MRVKKKLDTSRTFRIKGHTSLELATHCPDERAVFPSSPCVNVGCEYAIDEHGYMNCTFVAAEAGGSHTLEEIGEMMGVTREGVRVIEKRAMRKILVQLNQLESHASTVRQQGPSPGPDNDASDDEEPELEDETDCVPSLHDRELAQCSW